MRSGVAAIALVIALPPSMAVAEEQSLLDHALTAQVQEGGTIQAVRIVGAQRIEADTIRSYLTVQPGDKFANDGLDKSLKALFATGLFADVSLRRDGDDLIVRVVENPIINRIAYEGNKKFDQKKLDDEVQLRPRTVYTRTRVQADLKRILQLYRRAGRFAATVDPKIIQLSENRVDVVFEINEGKPTKIDSINFVGNKVFSNGKLQELISTKESHWWRFFSSADSYDPDRLTYDQELLRKFYLSQGYADFRVVSAVAELTPDRTAFIMTYRIEEGERYKFGKVDVAVALKDVKPESLKPLITMKTGDWYNASQVEAVVDSIGNALGDRGYAFVSASPNLNRNAAARTIDLTLQVGEGPRVYVERINIVGNVRTLDRVIRREFPLAEGDAFSTSKMKKAKQNLENLGFFKKVDIDNVPGSASDKTVLKTSVQEQSTGEFTVGTGFSTSQGVLGNASVHESNLLGRGLDARLSGTIAQYAKMFEFSFTNPYFMDRPIGAGFDIFDSQTNYSSISNYSFSSMGITPRVGFQIIPDLRATYSYTLRSDNLSNIIDNSISPYILAQSGSRTASVVGQTLLWDQRDNRNEPTAGYYVQLDSSVAGLGGSVKFVRNIADVGYFYTIYPQWTLRVSGEGGNVTGLGKRVNIQDSFFLGGDNLRGFADAGVGPHDITTDDALGGKTYYAGTVQMSVPLGLPEELGIAAHVFTDVGSLLSPSIPKTTIQDPYSSDPGLRVSSGFGFSWKSPMGPIAIDLGVPVRKKAGDKTEFFRVNFGTRL
jgi:outer membrane protein insertion porin family